MTEMTNTSDITTIEELQNKIKDYEDKQKFLLKIASYAYTAEHFNEAELIRVKKGDPYGMAPSEDFTEFESYASMVVKSSLNYEEYSNLPEKGRLLYSKNGHIVHEGDMKIIYGYLDHENKTFVKMELHYDSQTGSHKFL